MDPSFESVKDNWEYYYQYAKPFSTKDSCSELGIANFNCSPAEGSSMMLAYGFPTSVASKNGIYVYSYVAQRVAFPTGPSYLSFYLQASCSAMEQSEYFDIKIDDALFVEVTASECAKYESQRGNWTWMALPLGEHADGKEHTLLFEFYLGSATPYTVFAMDVLRFVTTSFTPDAQAGPCLDGSHPVALPQDGNAYNSSVSSRVCGWQAISCCRGTGLEEKVRTVIAEREGSPCDIASTCLKLLSTLTCIDCAPVNYSIINAETGKPRVCKDYAKHLYASCKGSRMEINGKSCARISALFENPKEFVNYFAEYTSSNRDDCFSMDYMPLLTPDEQEFMRDALKGKSLSGGAIAGIVVLCVVVVALVVIVVLAWIFVYRPRHPRMKGNDTDRMYGGGGSSSSSGKKNKNSSSSSKKKKDKKKDGSKKGKGDVELETMKTRKKKDGGGGAADNADGMKKKKKSDLDRVPKTMKSSKKPSGTGDEEEEEEEAGRAVGKKNVKGGKEDKKAASAKAKKKKSAASDNYEEEISY